MTDNRSEERRGRNDSDLLVQFVEVEPYYKYVLRAPFVKYTTWRERVNEEHKYGPPYVENELLGEAFVEEFSEKKPSLKSIHDCLSSKIDPNIPNKKNSNNRALHFAAKHGNVALMKMLLRASACVDKSNSFGQTPLHIASMGTKSKHTACVEVLLDAGCDVDFKDRGGGTALGQAIRVSNIFTVAALLYSGANCQWENKSNGNSNESTVALSIAKEKRAQQSGVNMLQSESYFAKLKENGPSLHDKIFKKRLCSPPSIVVDLIEKAQSGNLEEIEIMRKSDNNLRKHPSSTRNQIIKANNVRLSRSITALKNRHASKGAEGTSIYTQSPRQDEKADESERQKRIAMKKRIRNKIMPRRNRSLKT